MFGIIVGTHGQFATGIVQSCEMIFGKRDKLRAVTLMPGEGPDDVVAKYEQAIKELGTEKILFFNDLLGGSPYNAACRLVVANENYGIVAGVNLPGLIAMSAAQDIDDGSASIVEIMEQAQAACKDGVLSSSYESLNVESDDDEL
ncbi:MAG: PTS sugar transporter subunit IIA [Selenomonadaceae bacterium]|nr:PTS sugar transporter subunit IIA [Selenomonadaceae bacterium]MBQ3727451.1 PTS sugar transporter subunit IIA [Selenomonadaceae bacterium]MBQ9496614.1 PTS sugar transporter subunit IIA [Selenomonadaceae bacterium]